MLRGVEAISVNQSDHSAIDVDRLEKSHVATLLAASSYFLGSNSTMYFLYLFYDVFLHFAEF